MPTFDTSTGVLSFARAEWADPGVDANGILQLRIGAEQYGVLNVGGAVSNLVGTVSTTVDGQITLTFTGATGAVRHELRFRSRTFAQHNATPPGAWSAWSNWVATSSPHVHAGTAGTVYDFQVRAVFAVGQSPATGTTILAINTRPAQVTGVAAAVHPTETGAINVTWNAVSNAGGYHVSADNGATWSVVTGGAVTSYTFGGVVGQSYRFQVRAWRDFAAWGEWSSLSAAVTAVTRDAPGPPTSVRTTGTPGGTASFAWNAGARATGYEYRLFRGTPPPGGEIRGITAVGAGTLSIDTSFSTGSHPVTIEVRSTRGALRSEWVAATQFTSTSGGGGEGCSGLCANPACAGGGGVCSCGTSCECVGDNPCSG